MILDSVFDALEEHRRSRPSTPALLQVGGRCLTYEQLGRELDAVTAGLQQAGLQPGDAVVFYNRPTIEAVLLILGVVRCGGVIVAADPGMGPELFSARMALLAPKWLMSGSLAYNLARSKVVRSELERRGVRLPNFEVPGARLVLAGRWPPPSGALTYRALAATAGRPEHQQLDPCSAAFVVFTSGTTDAPKGVVHSRKSIGASLGMLSDLLRLESADRVYSDQLHMIVPALVSGATALLPEWNASPQHVLRDWQRLRPTHLYAVPSQLEKVLSQASVTGETFPDSLKVVLLGSAPVPAAFFRRCEAILPAASRVYAAYAMTEMLPVCWVEMSNKLAYAGPGDLVGAPCTGVELRIASDGEVWVKGPNLCAGYLGGPQVSEVGSGDIGVLQEGCLALLGRKKDMIIRGPYNVYPELIEGVAAAVPGVRRCAMVGLYMEHLADELIVLVVEPDDGIEPIELEHRVRHQLWESPQRIDVFARPDVILMSSVPLGGRSSKVDRAATRALVRRTLES